MSYDPKQHGAAQYNSYMHMSSGLVDTFQADEGSNNQELKERNFAQLVYQINSPPVTISGDVIVDSVGIDDSGTVKVSGDQLKVFDQGAIDAINNLIGEVVELQETVNVLSGQIIKDNYSRIIQEYGEDTFIAHAPIGTTIDTSGWRAQKIDEFGSRTWAGSGEFNQPGNIPLSALTYNY